MFLCYQGGVSKTYEHALKFPNAFVYVMYDMLLLRWWSLELSNVIGSNNMECSTYDSPEQLVHKQNWTKVLVYFPYFIILYCTETYHDLAGYKNMVFIIWISQTYAIAPCIIAKFWDVVYALHIIKFGHEINRMFISSWPQVLAVFTLTLVFELPLFTETW